mmetsp:Transcript_28184/g.84317  ORF Transcript_28184/g.84317 Transcript_28184/m.84317 type:complete len:314 (+) Transcript_28184:2597-3538(+)
MLMMLPKLLLQNGLLSWVWLRRCSQCCGTWSSTSHSSQPASRLGLLDCKLLCHPVEERHYAMPTKRIRLHKVDETAILDRHRSLDRCQFIAHSAVNLVHVVNLHEVARQASLAAIAANLLEDRLHHSSTWVVCHLKDKQVCVGPLENLRAGVTECGSEQQIALSPVALNGRLVPLSNRNSALLVSRALLCAIFAVLDFAVDEALEKLCLACMGHSKNSHLETVAIGPRPLVLLKDALFQVLELAFQRRSELFIFNLLHLFKKFANTHPCILVLGHEDILVLWSPAHHVATPSTVSTQASSYAPSEPLRSFRVT